MANALSLKQPGDVLSDSVVASGELSEPAFVRTVSISF